MASRRDYAQFLQLYDPTNDGTFTLVSVNGGQNNESTAQTEGSLDSQWSTVLGATGSHFYSIGNDGGSNNTWFEDELVAFGNYLSSVDVPPSSIATTWGMSEQTVTKPYATRICNEFMKAGCRGVTVLFSSGDLGVGRHPGCERFENHFPASCPYVTAVGATQFHSNGSETAPVAFASGGGFSDFFTTPDYQRIDVSKYIHNYIPSSYNGKYNANGRAYPDVALIGVNVPIITNGFHGMDGGTSASTPMWSGLISQINDYRATIGKPTLGFLNPRLYSDHKVRAALNDITQGSNPGCGTAGFSAQVGWDPVTGLGTMDFAKLRAALQC